MPISLTYENLISAEQAIVKNGGNVPYSLDSTLVFKTGVPLVGDVHVPLKYSGDLPLKSILSNPKAILQSPTAQKIARELIMHFFGEAGRRMN